MDNKHNDIPNTPIIGGKGSTPPEGMVEVEVADNIQGAEFSNVVNISHTLDTFLILWLNIANKSGKVVSKVILTPDHFQRVIKTMQEDWEKYQRMLEESKKVKEDKK